MLLLNAENVSFNIQHNKSLAILAQACAAKACCLWEITLALSQVLKDKFKAILSKEGKDSPLTIFQNGMTLMKAYKISYEQTVHPGEILTHKENRSGLMLTPTKVHNNILSMFKDGADKKKSDMTNSRDRKNIGPENNQNLRIMF